VERSASITAGSRARETSGTTAKSRNSCGSSTAWFVREHEQVQREFALERLGDEEVDELPRCVG
jgi:hypothetical protein